MKLHMYAVAIYNVRKQELVLETYYAGNPVVAAYIVAENEIGINFADNVDREYFSLEDAREEFSDYGFILRVRGIDK